MSDGNKKEILVIGAGWGRTGTNSFKLALEMLGYNPCYHMHEVIGLGHAEFWLRKFQGEKMNMDDVFFTEKAHFKATCDFPSAYYWKEQLEQYPNAKVVLTVRNPENWYQSARQTIFQADTASPFAPYGLIFAITWLGLPKPYFGRMIPVMMKKALNSDYSKENAIKAFNAFNDEVKKTCPKDKLLVFDVSDGWEPLCKFLGKPIPDAPFPHVNDTAEFRRIIIGLNTVGYFAMASLVTVPAIIAYYYLAYFNKSK